MRLHHSDSASTQLVNYSKNSDAFGYTSFNDYAITAGGYTSKNTSPISIVEAFKASDDMPLPVEWTKKS